MADKGTMRVADIIGAETLSIRKMTAKYPITAARPAIAAKLAKGFSFFYEGQEKHSDQENPDGVIR